MRQEASQTIKTPCGDFFLAASDKGLTIACFAEFRALFKDQLSSSSYGSSTSPNKSGAQEIINKAAKKISRYFKGDFQELATISLDPVGTPFQRKVWKVLCNIKPGKVLTYGEIATKIGSPGAARAVGLACRHNPLWLAIPCHRAVGKSGKLTGYRGGLEHKEFLLRHEQFVQE